MEREHGHRALLDSLSDLCAAWARDPEAEVKFVRYTDRKVAVLGAGLSGTAAAHFLKDEGARVTVLDSAEERTILKTTIEGMRARGIEVICGPDAERYAEYVEMVVLSPGIDPATPLAKNFS